MDGALGRTAGGSMPMKNDTFRVKARMGSLVMSTTNRDKNSHNASAQSLTDDRHDLEDR
jgi:hypothetical protein